MLPLVLSAYLLTSAVQPVMLAGNVLPTDAKMSLTMFGNSIRARILAPLVKRGMTAEKVFDILGEPSVDLGTGIQEVWVYTRSGVTVRFETPPSRYVVTDVWVAPFPEFIRRLFFATLPALRRAGCYVRLHATCPCLA